MLLTESELKSFQGTTRLHRWSKLTVSVLSDGARYVAETAMASQLFDTIDSILVDRQLQERDTLYRAYLSTDGKRASLTISTVEGKRVQRMRVPFEDFPIKDFETLARWNGGGWTHMLPSELQ